MDYNTSDDKLLDEEKEPSIELKAYEIPPETFCKAFREAYNFFHPTKEQAQWWKDHEDEINSITCLNLKPEDSLCEWVDKELKKIHNVEVNLDGRRRCKKYPRKMGRRKRKM